MDDARANELEIEEDIFDGAKRTGPSLKVWGKPLRGWDHAVEVIPLDNGNLRISSTTTDDAEAVELDPDGVQALIYHLQAALKQ